MVHPVHRKRVGIIAVEARDARESRRATRIRSHRACTCRMRAVDPRWRWKAGDACPVPVCACMPDCESDPADFDEPLEPALEIRQRSSNSGSRVSTAKSGIRPDHGADLHGKVRCHRAFAARRRRTRLPHSTAYSVVAAVVHGIGDINEVLPELAGHVFVSRIVLASSRAIASRFSVYIAIQLVPSDCSR